MAAPRTMTVESPLLRDALEGRARLLMDGGMGTLIQEAGLAAIHEVPDLLNLTHPQAVRQLQRRYVEAGADCITTNTFNANLLKLEGSGATVAEVYAAAAAIAREAGAPLVAGDIGPTGALLQPLGPLGFDEAYDIFAEQARAAEAAGCQLIVVETFSDLLEAKAALLACLENTALPVLCSMTFGEDGRTFMGTTPAIAAATLSAMGASAVGLNCSLGPAELAELLRQMAPYARCPLMVQPNAGLPRVNERGETVFDVGPDEFSAAMEGILAAGAAVVGGCCGTTPAHIARLRQLLAEAPFAAPAYRPSFLVTSAQAMAELRPDSPNIAVIGERINPTGKKRLKAALLAGDFDVAVAEAVAQVGAGADILDVNVGVPGLDEPAVLRAVAQRLQATVTAPLQLDSSSPEALEAACRTYAGRPLINSVTGKAESLAAVLPVAARYGATVLGLTLDEGGIPPTAQERFAIARRIVEAAEAAGIPREDVAIDCLVMAAATNQDEIPQILEALRLCKQQLGVRTVLGVSNVSFGLPRRPVLNAAFLTAALASGLDMPILNPLEPRYQDALRAFKVINGQDGKCLAYLEAYVGTEEAAPVAAVGSAAIGAAERLTDDSPRFSAEEAAVLYQAVLTGRPDGAAAAATALLAQQEPVAIAGDVLSPALDEVGRRYDAGTYFLPQLMAAAEAAKAAFDVLSAANGQSADVPAAASTPIVIATVEGDIHDIGKNIVRMLLENYGFAVRDLGRDVAPQAVLDAVRETGARLVGLSALMTTTVGAMERTIALLRQEAPGVSVMVGGAVLTADYAAQIGADFYVEDAAASVKVAKQLL
ncbi:homocysteine S-methyltransferase family protein [Parvibacter caecicola]|uniref:homocysteine S-methyltransferase family protein n=1 Tax=Parvibacter caecicola TaxID=747645 RepID=UPI0023F01517|nr:homocysteine S-methyltransferase family protein [Parvibacter caecicola]